MLTNLIGVLVSYLYILIILAAVTLALKKEIVGRGVGRKIIHIGVCHWWFIALLMIDGLGWALVGPVSFIIINFIIARKDLLPGMNNENGRNYGTVYFPVTLVILLLAVYRFRFSPAAAGAGVMVMGWGDGMAAVAGEKINSPSVMIFGNRKSLAGSCAMFIFSFAVLCAAYIFSGAAPDFLLIFLISAAATAVEFITPYGLDNLSVPITVTLLSHFTAAF